MMRDRIEPRLVDLLCGLRRYQVQEAMNLLLNYIDERADGAEAARDAPQSPMPTARRVVVVNVTDEMVVAAARVLDESGLAYREVKGADPAVREMLEAALFARQA